jgi:hypothetical protein
MPADQRPKLLLAVNMYVAYVIAMLLILALMASMIGAINFALNVAKNFVSGDWRYRRKVLLALAIIFTVVFSAAGYACYCIVTDPPS